MQRYSKVALQLIKYFEGFRAEAYKCPKGVWTIGYGQTAGVKPGMKTTLDAAEKDLIVTVENLARDLFKGIPETIPQTYCDALLSLAYNVGQGGCVPQKRRLMKHRLGDFERVHLQYRNPGESVEEGLFLRRVAERLWAETGSEGILNTFLHDKDAWARKLKPGEYGEHTYQKIKKTYIFRGL